MHTRPCSDSSCTSASIAALAFCLAGASTGCMFAPLVSANPAGDPQCTPERGERNLSIRSVRVSGGLTKNGEPSDVYLNDTPPHVRFVDVVTGAVYAEQVRDGRYELEVPVGRYEVAVFQIDAQAAVFSDPPVLVQEVLLSQSTTLDLDVSTAVVELSLTWGGQAFPEADPSSAGGRGRLLIRPDVAAEGQGWQVWGSLPEEGPALVALEVPAGNVRVAWVRSLDVSETVPVMHPVLPIGEIDLGPVPVELTPGVRVPVALDVPDETIVLKAEVVAGGAELVDRPPGDDRSRGFVHVATGTIPLGTEGPARFEVRLVPGRVPLGVYLNNLAVPGLDGWWALASPCPEDGCLMTADTTLDIDVVELAPDDPPGPAEATGPKSQVEVEVLLWGVTAPDDQNLDEWSEGRGELVFAPTDGSPWRGARLPLPETGPAVASGEVVDGDYVVWLDTMTISGRGTERGLRQTVFPIGRHRLGEARVEGGSASFVFDTQIEHVTLQVWSELDEAKAERTALVFRDEDGGVFWSDVDDQVELKLYPGAYQVFAADTQGIGGPGVFPESLSWVRMSQIGQLCVTPGSSAPTMSERAPATSMGE